MPVCVAFEGRFTKAHREIAVGEYARELIDQRISVGRGNQYALDSALDEIEDVNVLYIC